MSMTTTISHAILGYEPMHCKMIAITIPQLSSEQHTVAGVSNYSSTGEEM